MGILRGGTRSRGLFFRNEAIFALFFVGFGVSAFSQVVGGKAAGNGSLVAEAQASLYRADTLATTARRERNGVWEEFSLSLLARDVEAAATHMGLANFGVSVADNAISIIYRDILFQPNSDLVTPETAGKVKSLAKVLARFAKMRLKVEGHTAKLSETDKDDGVDLSGRRAKSVATLIAGTGIFSADNIETYGRGYFQPIADNTTTAGKTLNRRVEISIEQNMSADASAQADTVWWKLFSDSKAPGFSAYLVTGRQLEELSLALNALRLDGLFVAKTENGVGVLDEKVAFLDDGSPTRETQERQAILAKALLALDANTLLRIGGYGSSKDHARTDQLHYFLGYSAAKAGISAGFITISEAPYVMALATAELTELRLEGSSSAQIEVTEAQEGDGKVYTAFVPYAETSLRFQVMTADASATVSLNLGDISHLAVGLNEFGFHVGAKSRAASTEKAYKLIVERAEVSLAGLSVSEGHLEPAFKPEIRSYHLSVPFPVGTFSLNPDLAEPDAKAGATFTILTDLSKGLAVGDNRLTLRLTNDVGGTQDYIVVVNREAPSTLSTLTTLSVAGINGEELPLSPTFSSAKHTYSLSLPFIQDRLTLAAHASDAQATIDFVTGQESNVLFGQGELRVKVTAEDGESSTEYFVVTQREEPTLSSIELGGAVLSPVFDPAVRMYRVYLPFAMNTLDIRPVMNLEDAAGGAVVALDDKYPIDYQVGETMVKINLAGEDGAAGSYTLAVVREAAAVSSTLQSLSLLAENGEELALHPAFSRALQSYSVEVPFGLRKLELVGSAADEKSLVSQAADTEAGLRVGENERSLKVIAEDGQTNTEYRVVVRRALPRLESLSLDAGDLDPPFNPDTRVYRSSVPYSVDSIQARAGLLSGDAAAGARLAEAGDAPFGLQPGENEVVVSLSDGEISAGEYRVTVLRAYPSADSKLLGLALRDGLARPLDLNPPFDGERSSYQVEVPYAIDEVALELEAPRGSSLSLATGSKEKLRVGENQLVFNVGAEDGVTVSTYSLLVIRNAEPVVATATMPASESAPAPVLVASPEQAPVAANVQIVRLPKPSLTLATEPFFRPGYSFYTGGGGVTIESGLSLALGGTAIDPRVRNLRTRISAHYSAASGNYLTVSSIGGYVSLGYALLPRELFPEFLWLPDVRIIPEARIGAVTLEVLFKNGLYQKGMGFFAAPAFALDLGIPGMEKLRLGMDVAFNGYYSGLPVQSLFAGCSLGWKF